MGNRNARRSGHPKKSNQIISDLRGHAAEGLALFAAAAALYAAVIALAWAAGAA